MRPTIQITDRHSSNFFIRRTKFPAFSAGHRPHEGKKNCFKFAVNLTACYCVHIFIFLARGLGGLGVTCSPRDPRFAGSNPAEVDGFYQDVKILSTSPPGGTLSWGSRF